MTRCKQVTVPAAVKEAVEHAMPAVKRAHDFFVEFFAITDAERAGQEHVHTVLSEGFSELRACFSKLAAEVNDVSCMNVGSQYSYFHES